MAVDKNRIIEHFGLRPFGNQGWMRSDSFTCPNCKQNDEFAVKFTKDGGGVVHCLHTRTCNGFTSSLEKYLRSIGKADLIEFDKSIDINDFPNFGENDNSNDSVCYGFKDMPLKQLPIGFKKVYHDEYLENRNFLPEHYDMFGVGVTHIDPRYKKKYLIFQFFNDNGGCIAWMARSRMDKEWHTENKRLYKEEGHSLYPRYGNSPDTDFNMLLGGYGEVTENTETIILVEGIFDKVNIDNKLQLVNDDNIKCLFTFGNSISPNQIGLIEKLNSIKNIYLLYDSDASKNSAKYGIELEAKTDKNIYVSSISQKGIDPGDMGLEQIHESLTQKSVNSLCFNFRRFDGIQ